MSLRNIGLTSHKPDVVLKGWIELNKDTIVVSIPEGYSVKPFSVVVISKKSVKSLKLKEIQLCQMSQLPSSDNNLDDCDVIEQISTILKEPNVKIVNDDEFSESIADSNKDSLRMSFSSESVMNEWIAEIQHVINYHKYKNNS